MSEFTVQDETDLEDGLFTEGHAENPADTASSRNSSSSEEDVEGADVGPTYKGIVRTRCGHIFHKECLSGWVGGRWQLNAQGGNNDGDETGTDSRRRARQTQCPLCREDLRPPSPPSN